jgi:hypothetical protein
LKKDKTKPKPKLVVPPAEAEKLAPGKARSAAATSTSHRVWLLVGIGVAVAVLFVVAAVVAYQIGKGNKAETPPTPAKSAPDAILTPAQAADHVGDEHTVEFKVRSVTGETYLELNSEAEAGDADGFAVRLPASFFKTPADRAQVQREFTGKTIRVRGKIQRDPQAGLFIDAETPKQLIPVGK